jgi:hypothetical protein
MGFSDKAEKSRKNRLWAAAEGSNFVFMKNKAYMLYFVEKKVLIKSVWYIKHLRTFFSTKWDQNETNRWLWPFFRFFHVSVEALGRRQKKVTIPKLVAIIEREIFLNIGKNWNTLAIKSAEKKRSLANKFSLFFCLIMEKSKLLIPSSARYAWGLDFWYWSFSVKSFWVWSCVFLAFTKSSPCHFRLCNARKSQ